MTWGYVSDVFIFFNFTISIKEPVSAVQDVLIWAFYSFSTEAWVELFGSMHNWPTARWLLKPNLMMACKCVFTPTLHRV